jgi:ferredoxin
MQHRVPLNVPGKFFVDDQCLDCDLCRDIAPNNFSRDDARGVAYVSRQPSRRRNWLYAASAV